MTLLKFHCSYNEAIHTQLSELLDVMGLLEQLRVVEEVRYDFIGWRQTYVLGVRPLNHRVVEGKAEERVVDSGSAEQSCLVECVKVLGIIEEFEDGLQFLDALRIVHREDSVVWHETVLKAMQEFLHCILESKNLDRYAALKKNL